MQYNSKRRHCFFLKKDEHLRIKDIWCDVLLYKASEGVARFSVVEWEKVVIALEIWLKLWLIYSTNKYNERQSVTVFNIWTKKLGALNFYRIK